MSYNDEITFELCAHYGVIGQRNDGWKREVNLVSWNGGVAKFDIREWDIDHKRMTRGITLFEDEAEKLYEVLKSVFDSESN